MIKKDIVSRISENTPLTFSQSENVVDHTLEILKIALKREGRIELRGFGIFSVKAKKTGMGRNPRTGELIPIVKGNSIRFKPGKEIRFNGAGPGSDQATE